MSALDHTFVVILAGGGGTRLWPKSREKTPKQFLRLFSSDSLLQEAYSRIRELVPADRIIVVTNIDYVDEVRRQLPDVPNMNIIGEPQKRETAPAMLLGAMIAYKRDPEAVVINQASDHVVTNWKEFIHVSKTAIEVARSGDVLVTVGITPTYPNTGFGYIQIDGKLEERNGLSVYKVDKFTEKPDEKTASQFIATGKYYWNANNYVWKASALIQAFDLTSPDILGVMRSLEASIDTLGFTKELERVYDEVEKISIDYAVSEKAKNLVLIPGDFGWDDVGSWGVVHDLKTKNELGNAVIADMKTDTVVFHDSKNNLVQTHGRLVALVGVHDTIVIDTGEILLVMPKSKSQDVKKIVEQIKVDHPEFL